MARKHKPQAASDLYSGRTENASWIESDSYESPGRWAELGLTAPTIGELVESGERLVPILARFCMTFSWGSSSTNLVWLKPDPVRRNAGAQPGRFWST